ncbi:MAG: DivIVA domain-containing protein [Deinococcota bacterium]|jgi:cell division initiation protein|uniref:DivIVA domain protein n=1 Tax=Allomeiothermus silvanus (strain ATCC 700542 / DSM 9946 / NBRC 106475 / NCIMB 13440 / VI-R2) TaxID=526227 RepID=D7BIF3_ALLS1|nr:DivIVA domain protein [Allomeiothermus silvanus DSM 9946]MBI5811935.1 DivIVA domain-containing protein [Allomeiothermus silvanus]
MPDKVDDSVETVIATLPGVQTQLTALDVRYQEFKRGMRGYVVADVREYLGRVADQLGMLLDQNEALRSRIRALEAELAEAKEGEAELRRAVVAAERIAREIRAQAERDAELIKKEAESAREVSLQEVVAEMKRVRVEIEQLKNERDLFVSQFRAMLEGYLSSLEKYRR